jgi:DNA-binding transcriptional LysR family regulator
MNIRKLDLNLLLVFDAIYAEASITRAAKRLGITQPALSNALRRLREHLGDPLFERDGHGVAATPEARRLAPAIQVALRSIEQAVARPEEFDPASSPREFSVIVPEALEPLIMPALLNAAARDAPNVSFVMRPLFAAGIEQPLSDKSVDLGFYLEAIDREDIQSSFITAQPICIAARADHPIYTTRERFTAEDLCEAGFVVIDSGLRKMTRIEQAIQARGLSRRVVCAAPRIWSLPYIVAETDLVAMVPRALGKYLAPKLNLKLFDLPFEVPNQDWYMVWHKDFDLDPAHVWLRRRVLALFHGA